jgi:hypothetical protein
MPFFRSFSGVPKRTWAVTVDPGNITAGTTVATDVTLKGLRPGMVLVFDLPALEAGLIPSLRVKAKDTAELRLFNSTGSAVNPAAQTLYVVAL